MPGHVEAESARINEFAFFILCTDYNLLYPLLVMVYQLRKSIGNSVDLLVNTRLDLVGFERAFSHFNVKIKLFDKPLIPKYLSNNYEFYSRDLHIWQKLWAWNQTEYHKIILIDLDMLVLSDLTGIFSTKSELAGVPGLFKDEKIMFWEPPRPFSMSPTDKRAWNNLERFRGSSIGAGLNGGLVLLRPDRQIFNKMITAISFLDTRLCCPIQEFIYRFFELNGGYSRLDPRFNMRKLHKLTGRHTPDLERIDLYHFVERLKPWMQQSNVNSTRCGMTLDWLNVAKNTEDYLLMYSLVSSSQLKKIKALSRELRG